jgi:hypothetical protein
MKNWDISPVNLATLHYLKIDMENPPSLDHLPREPQQISVSVLVHHMVYTQMKWNCRHLETFGNHPRTSGSSEMREGQVLQSCPARHGALPRRQSGCPHTLAT